MQTNVSSLIVSDPFFQSPSRKNFDTQFVPDKTCTGVSDGPFLPTSSYEVYMILTGTSEKIRNIALPSNAKHGYTYNTPLIKILYHSNGSLELRRSVN